MLRRVAPSVVVAMVVAVTSGASPALAQWLKYPTPNVPRTSDGKPDLSAPTPRTADGKPDFSGMWLTADGFPCAQSAGGEFLACGLELPISRYGINMGMGVKGGLPYKAGVEAIVKQRTADQS